MSPLSSRTLLSRRNFIRLFGGAAVTTAGAALIPQYLRKTLLPVEIAQAQAVEPPPDLYFAGTDGWIYLPPDPPIGFYHPDSYAPAPFTTYIFGFHNITGLNTTQVGSQKNKAQHNAPLFWVDEYDETILDPNTNKPKEFRLQLTNLGFTQRPDLVDSHTIHWHGFRNVIPFYDGEPNTSVSVPVGRNFTYVYRPRDPGTYMYHCHVEDVEHVHMGMTGLVFVRPKQNWHGNSAGAPVARYNGGPATAPLGYAYDDGVALGDPLSTAYDREFAMFLSEVWAEAHWDDAHIQLPEWTDYHADFALLNGRVYPDTLAPNGSINPFNVAHDANGDIIPPAGRPELQYQPLSALITCQPGERVLLRFANLGFKEAAMTLAGIPMKVIGLDATLMRSRDGTDTSYTTNTISISAGESFDVIFTAPAFSGGSGSSGNGYDSYTLYNRSYARSDNLAGADGFGDQRTEVRVYPSGTLAAQQYPNDWGM
mgnify:CR=1 FL=1